MTDHEITEEEDGWVRCSCGRSFCDNSTLEAIARQRWHVREEQAYVNAPSTESEDKP